MVSAIVLSAVIAITYVLLVVVGISIEEFSRRESRKAQVEQMKNFSQQKK